MSGFPNTRMRRLRRISVLREMVQDVSLRPQDLILPLFIKEQGESSDISSMPGHRQISLQDLPAEVEELQRIGVCSVMLFGIPAQKDAVGSASLDDEGVVQRATQIFKSSAPEILVITDVCFCEYTDHGHCGALCDTAYGKDVDNDATLKALGQQAVSHVKAGADIVAPSGMMDGMIAAIRSALDEAGFYDIAIMSYAVKYASGFYGPFREAAEGAPQFGDRKSYQMDFARHDECLREAKLDIKEGADFIMVKPALAYLDIIARLHQAYPAVPMAAYQVSGEFSMIKAAAEKGWINEQAVMLESLIAIKRAGATCIISYFTKDVVRYLQG